MVLRLLCTLYNKRYGPGVPNVIAAESTKTDGLNRIKL
jgi:hypothetical protein